MIFFSCDGSAIGVTCTIGSPPVRTKATYLEPPVFILVISYEDNRPHVNRRVQPPPLTIDPDRRLIDRAPRRHSRRRVGLAIGQPMRPRPNRAM